MVDGRTVEVGVAHAVAEFGSVEVWMALTLALAVAVHMERPQGKHPVVPAESSLLAIPPMGLMATLVDVESAEEAV
jgi:hypothetical protein